MILMELLITLPILYATKKLPIVFLADLVESIMRACDFPYGCPEVANRYINHEIIKNAL